MATLGCSLKLYAPRFHVVRVSFRGGSWLHRWYD